MWDGRHFRCSGCGEIYCASTEYCPCCKAVCVALDPDPVLPDSPIDPPAVSLVENETSGFRDVLEGLTDDQRVVVEIDSGRHLVLAPPGTGKTEMLTRRVVRALAAGRNVRRMFCGTFTIRAAVEMRDRISSVTKLPREKLPEIGNLHHFCYAFLTQHHFVPRERQIIDEVFAREMIEDCISEFKEQFGRKESTSDGGYIYRLPGEAGVPCDGLTPTEVSACKGCLDLCYETAEDKKPVVVKVSTGMEGMRQRLAGIPERLCEPEVKDIKQRDFIADILGRYNLIKKRLSVIDFDDLLIETYARLSNGGLADDEKFDWIQVDEVQDLNPLQWEIVEMVAAPNALVVYFGDYDQSIFSFMGASLSTLDEKARTSVVHSFKKNFRATSYLLDLLTRYSFKVLESRFPFVPSPHVYENAAGALAITSYEFDVVYTIRYGIEEIDYKSTRELKRTMMLNTAIGHVYECLNDGVPGRVAVLVQTNNDANAIADCLSEQNIAGVVRFSGNEFSHCAAFRNAAALFETVANPYSRPAWSRLFYLLASKSAVPNQKRARELAMSLFETGMIPTALLQDGATSLPDTLASWVANHAKFVQSFRDGFSRYRREFLKRIGGQSTMRDEIIRFRDYVDAVNKEQEQTPIGQLEHFFSWTDARYATDKRPFAEVLAKDWLDLSRMKEADMLTDQDRVVVSTVHKAKGLQFDTVVIPDADGYPSYYAGKTRAGIDESARLLYVALSRAKRQLILLRGVAIDRQGCPCDQCSGRARFIEPIVEAFASSFADFYYRKDQLNQSLEEIGKTDWLAIQFRVAEAVQMHHTLPDVELLIHHPQPSIRRMAVLTLEWEENGTSRDVLLKELLSNNDGKVVRNAVYVIGKLQCIDLLKDLRSLMSKLGPEDHSLKLDILSAYESMPDSPKVRELIGDSVYDVDGGIRREAVRVLCTRGDGMWKDVIRGDPSDWKRMAGVQDGMHTTMLGWMVKHHRPFVCQELKDLLQQNNLKR